jgi:hypothetical protein
MDNDQCLGAINFTTKFNVEYNRETSSAAEAFSRMTPLYGPRQLPS